MPAEVCLYFNKDVQSGLEAGRSRCIVCKFVLLANRSNLFLLIGPVSDYPYHAHLVNRFCREREIPSGWVAGNSRVEIFDTHHKIRGGGWMKIEQSEKRLEIYGHSTAYGRFSEEDLDSILKSDAFLREFPTIVIR
ncbi:MAG: hypothetical protein SGI97_04675 [candidate division Zixibacteria bacterium]|nr:hypothetical protein [candidate division Zixibacteria bacterium]